MSQIMFIFQAWFYLKPAVQIQTGHYGVLMGRTGCGKTTLLETIAGLKPVTSGRIILSGHDVTVTRPAQRGIGYVVRGGRRFFEREEVKKAMVLLRAAAVGDADAEVPVAARDALTEAGWAEEPPAPRGNGTRCWCVGACDG